MASSPFREHTPPVLSVSLSFSCLNLQVSFFFIWLCKIAKTPCTAFTPALCAYRCSESKLCSAGMQPLWSFHHVCRVVFIFRQILLSPDVLMNAEGMTNVEFLIQYLFFVWHDWMSLLLLLLLLLLLSYKLFSAHQHIFLYPAELALWCISLLPSEFVVQVFLVCMVWHALDWQIVLDHIMYW